MKFSVDVPDEVFWRVAQIAEGYELRVPDFVAAVAARLTVEPAKEGNLEALQAELRAARNAGWRAPHEGSLRRPRKARSVVFTDRQMEAALAVFDKKRNG